MASHSGKHGDSGEQSADAGELLVLGPRVLLRRLEEPCVYLPAADELFVLDDEAFAFLRRCAVSGGVARADIADKEFLETCLAEGILHRSAEPANRDHQPSGTAPLPSLRYLEVQITRRCNLACRHCYLGNAAAVDLDPERFRSLLDDFDALQGLRVLISGGEPLCHPDFWEINEIAKASPLRSVLLTNGMAIESTDVSALGVDEVQVSIDGLKRGHDSLRGPGTFDRVLAALAALKRTGLDVSVATMAHPGNIDELEGLSALLHEVGVIEWNVDVPCSGGRWKDNPLSVEDMGRALSYGFGGSLHGAGAGSGTCGAHLMAITPEGFGTKCGFYSDRTVGSIEDGLSCLWARVPRPSLGELTCRCDHLDACRGGCRYRAEKAGDGLGPDPAKCAAFGVAPRRA